MVGSWSEFGQGPNLIKTFKALKILRMGLPTVNNISEFCGKMFSLIRSTQLHFNKKLKEWIELFYSSLFHLLGILSWGQRTSILSSPSHLAKLR